MDTMPGTEPMDQPPLTPLAGLNPADLLQQGLVDDTLVGDSPVAFELPAADDLAARFPQFEILGLIGQGGMGAVYKVRQQQLDRIVALKILPPTIGQTAEFSNRFTREAKALAKLNHPGIVTLHEFGQADGLYFIVMEFVDGVNLRQLMATDRIAPRQALAIVPQICDALQFAHDHGIVHRDIKPENILLDRLGRVKVADFGIAKLVGAADDEEAQRWPQTDATVAGKIMGTPHYMAPEQLEHPSEVDHRADIYALGVVFYQMLTGELPGKDLQAPSRKVQIDVRLDEIVLRAMAKDPELRYQQASVMRTRVEGLEQGAPPPALPPAAYAGFWRRVLACVIDYNLVAIALFPCVLVLATMVPSSVVVSVPFGLFTTEKTVETKPSQRKNADGSITALEERIVEVTALGKWLYLYREKIEHSAGKEDKSRQLIDPASRQEIHTMTSETLVLWVLMIYWILMESSVYQASIGKMWVGIRVGDRSGGRISLARAAGRNAAKVISAATLMIGFMMAGWTRNKQALHDIWPDCYLTKSAARADGAGAVTNRSVGTQIALGCGVLVLVGIVVMAALSAVFYFRTRAQEAQQAKQTKAQAPPPAAHLADQGAAAAASPVQVFTLERGGALGGVDLDTGTFVSYEPTGGLLEPEGAARWREDNGIDLVLDLNSHMPGVLVTGTQVTDVPSEWWDEIPAAETLEALLPPQNHQSLFDERMSFLCAAGPSAGTKTHVYRTPAGSAGILRLDRSYSSGGVRVQWRMIVARKASAQGGLPDEVPQLRRLAWQDQVNAGLGKAWLPSGEDDPSDIGMPARAGVDISQLPAAKENPRFLCLWFTHPLFDALSVAEISLLAADGKASLDIPSGELAIGRMPAWQGASNVGWITATLCAGTMNHIPPRATVILRYSVGAWQFWDDIAPDFCGTQALG
ncbi:MAG: protein kinase, partial [Verrucomicrobiota bacterium]